MDNLTLILMDGTELSLDAFGLPCHAVMSCASNDELMARWKLLTPMNLSRIEIKQDGETVFAYSGVNLDGVQSAINGDGSMTVHFYMSGTRLEVVSENTQEYVTAAQIMMGEVADA